VVYRQTIIENTGVKSDEFLPGYSHDDGLRFDKNDPINQMMEIMAVFLIKIGNIIDAKTILDVGSGSGALSYYLRKIEPTLKVVTLDGNQGIINSPFIDKDKHFIVRTDQEYKIVDENNEIVKFDLIVSFEHLEHIQEENFEQFLKNIFNHSHKNSIFFGTAATWNYEKEEEKHIHCNVKNVPEWRTFLEEENQHLFSAGSIHDLNYQMAHIQEYGTLPPHSSKILADICRDLLVLSRKDDEDTVAKKLNWSHRLNASVLIILGYG
jgi:SAM-dependent methyltransferase